MRSGNKNIDTGTLSAILASGVALDGAGLALLATELAKPAYAGLTLAQKVLALNEPTYGLNPDAQTEVRLPITVGALKEWFRPMIFARLGDATGQKWLQKAGLLLSQYKESEAVSYDSATFTPLRVEVLADGMITQEALDALFPVVADPSYQATILLPSPATALFGSPGEGLAYFLDDADVLTAEAL